VNIADVLPRRPEALCLDHPRVRVERSAPVHAVGPIPRVLMWISMGSARDGHGAFTCHEFHDCHKSPVAL
jgi:hypothetical protein